MYGYGVYIDYPYGIMVRKFVPSLMPPEYGLQSRVIVGFEARANSWGTTNDGLEDCVIRVLSKYNGLLRSIGDAVRK